jgi:hypothetical protein
VDHPYYLPKFANALTFTFPFVVENGTAIYLPLLSLTLLTPLRLNELVHLGAVMKVLADVLTAIGEIGVTSEEEAQWATEVRPLPLPRRCSAERMLTRYRKKQ